MHLFLFEQSSESLAKPQYQSPLFTTSDTSEFQRLGSVKLDKFEMKQLASFAGLVSSQEYSQEYESVGLRLTQRFAPDCQHFSGPEVDPPCRHCPEEGPAEVLPPMTAQEV